VAKIRRDGKIASDSSVYVDDSRHMAHDHLSCWLTTRRFCSVIGWLGMQDASRKRTKPTTLPGPTAGSVIHTEGRLLLTVSVERWAKTQGLVKELDDMLANGRPLPKLRLEQIRGYLIYITRTFSWAEPYLKGLHLTIDGWRRGRDSHGFRVPKPRPSPDNRLIWEWKAGIWEEEPNDETPAQVDPPAPEFVEPAPRLRFDVDSLLSLFNGDAPAAVPVRASRSTALYLMGDASGAGFGSAFWDNAHIDYQAGCHAPHLAVESSNFREADNLVSRLEELALDGRLLDSEIFVITDNQPFEGTYYKGHSSSKKLNDIILRLRILQRTSKCILHVIHVSGTRMKDSGIDGLSRGDLSEGMMIPGAVPLSFVPFHLGANERSEGKVLSWVTSWWQDKSGLPWGQAPLTLLSPNDWFQLSKSYSPRLWCPPPAAMTEVLEMFSEDRLAHPFVPHVFVVPRLMTHLWRKALSKDADLMVTLNTNHPFWNSTQHEPLLLCIVLPCSPTNNYFGPWVAKGAPGFSTLESYLQQGLRLWARDRSQELPNLEGHLQGLWSNQEEWTRAVLLEFLSQAGDFPPVRECLVRKLFQATPLGPLPNSRKRRRGRGRDANGDDRARRIQGREGWGPPYGSPV
jgi:hypothetical protein